MSAFARSSRRFVEAWEHSDVDAVAAMLTDDAIFAMPPVPTWYAGREAGVSFLRGWPFSRKDRFRMVPVRANGQLGFVHYMRDDAGRLLPHGITLLALRGDRIAELTSFLDAGIPERFGLPAAYQPHPERE